MVQRNASKCAVFYIKGVGFFFHFVQFNIYTLCKSWSMSTLKKPAMGFLLHKIQHILMYFLLGHFIKRKPLYIWRVTRKSQRKLIKKKRLFVLRPKTNHGWCRPALFDLVKGPFISKRISFSFAIKKTGKKSNTQIWAMKIIHSNFASWEQNNLWPKCFFFFKYINAFQSDETIFLKIWLKWPYDYTFYFFFIICYIYICIVSIGRMIWKFNNKNHVS